MSAYASSHRQRLPWPLLDPDSNRLAAWDVTTGLTLLFVAIFTWDAAFELTHPGVLTSHRRMLSSTITLIVTITTDSRTAATTLANAVDAANVGLSTLGGLDVDSVTSAVVIYVNPDDDDGLSGEVIAGIAVGTCAGVALIAVIAVMVFKKK